MAARVAQDAGPLTRAGSWGNGQVKRFGGSPAKSPSVVAAPVNGYGGGGVRHGGDRSDRGGRNIASVTSRADSNRHDRNDAPQCRADKQATAYTECASQVVALPADPPTDFNDWPSGVVAGRRWHLVLDLRLWVALCRA
jgi:hypothetical protein